MTISRRNFLGASGGMALVSASAVSGRAQAAAIPEAATMKEAVMQPPLVPTSGPDVPRPSSRSMAGPCLGA